MNITTAEKNETLWLLAVSPAIWAGHFMLSYATAAIWCAKLPDPEGSLVPVRLAIGSYTAVALAAIGIVGYIGFRRHTSGSATLPHDADTPEDRHRFLGFSTFLLSGLSGVAVLYAALVAVFVRSCE